MENQILRAVALLIPMVLSLTVHEYSHAFAAKKLDDPTAERLGRLTMNPIAHIDPIGTIFLPLMGFMFGGFIFGWAKPVPVNPVLFTRRLPMKTGMLLVAAAGPASNLIMALIASLLMFLVVHVIGFVDQAVLFIFVVFIKLNVILAFFNLLPIPPLDGGRILGGLLPDRFEQMLASIERYGFIVLIFLLFSGAMSYLFIPVTWVSDFLIGWPEFLQ